MLGWPPIALAASLTIPGLRVLAYHDVPDQAAFRRHVELIRRRFRPVGAAEVVAAAAGGPPLPARALWVTFDDGHPSSLAAGADLARAGIAATVFVCPGVLDTDEPLWWQVVDATIARDAVPADLLDGRTTAGFRAWLKTVRDDVRRDAVDRCRLALASTGAAPAVTQATTAQLADWVAQGHHVGNHTWDHPLLDRCSEPEQDRQVRAAHDWLRARFPDQPLVFAYPNGNTAPVADETAAGLGYPVRLLFDHRVAPRRPVPQLSRLRIDADASLPRLRAVASGAHALAFAAGHR